VREPVLSFRSPHRVASRPARRPRALALLPFAPAQAPDPANPALAYQALFGSAAGGAAKQAFDARKPLLDHLAADVKRAEAALAGPEREKLQSYLRAFETMRDRHGKLVEMEVVLKKHAPPVIDKFTSAVENGTMFDNTLIVYLSDGAEGHHSRCWEWPAVLVGNLGGALKTGRYLELPGHGARGHKHIGNLYTTLPNAAGDTRESFGQPDPILGGDVDQKGGIAELRA
jgi:hypothetical protein